LIPGWIKDAAPRLLALLLAAILWMAHMPAWALGVLGLSIVGGFLYQQWMLGHLANWAVLPSVRELGFKAGNGNAWSQVFDKLTRSYASLKDQNLVLRSELISVHAAVDKIDDALVLLDKYSLITWSNRPAQSLFGFVGAAGVNRPMHHYLRDPKFSEMLDRQFHTPTPLHEILRLNLQQRPGLIFEVELVKSDDGKQLVIVRDVTPQAKLDAVKSDFIANISHEIRTPLTVVTGYTETLIELELSKEEQHKHLETILKQSRTMQNLVADLLTLSSLEQEVDAKIETNVDLQRLFNDTESQAKVLSSGRHQIAFVVDHPAKIRGVPDELASALGNLVSNAIRYTPDGGKIYVHFKFEAGFGYLSVQDSGMGVAAEHIMRLTERFYRVDRGRSRGSGGTGLGLAIVKRIANRHQMDLEITSVIAQGSTFTLKVPASRILFEESEASRQLSLT
jgi:two-component system, OmpR family, phosphate regulon sensor histidine kinase PhoR